MSDYTISASRSVSSRNRWNCNQVELVNQLMQEYQILLLIPLDATNVNFQGQRLSRPFDHLTLWSWIFHCISIALPILESKLKETLPKGQQYQMVITNRLAFIANYI